MDNYLVSVCIPAYNSAKFIGETIQSVLNQTYQHWELLIMEDGTDDGTKNIVESLATDAVQKIQYIAAAQNKGVSATRNELATLAKGTWIAFLDSDDLWDNNHLASLVALAKQQPEASLIHSGTDVFDSDSREILFRENLTEEQIALFPVSIFDKTYGIQLSSAMIRSDLFASLKGFDVRMRYSEDFEFYFRCARAGCKFAFTGANTGKYRKHITGLSANYTAIAEGAAIAYEKHFDWVDIPFSLREKMVSDTWFSVAKMSRKTNKSLARVAIKKAVKYKKDPLFFLYYILLTLT